MSANFTESEVEAAGGFFTVASLDYTVTCDNLSKIRVGL